MNDVYTNRDVEAITKDTSYDYDEDPFEFWIRYTGRKAGVSF